MYNHEFEITIGRKSDDYWPIHVRVNQLDGIASYLPEMKLQLNLTEIIGTPKAKDYGILLGKALFQASFLNTDSDATTLRERLKEELGKVDSGSNKNRIRILLSIDNAKDKDLNTLHWQKLCALIDSGVWSFLAKDQRVAFSMYIPTAISTNFPTLRQDQLRALVLVASPSNLPESLKSFPVDDIISDLQKVFEEKKISYTFLANTNGCDPPTLENLKTKFTEAAEKEKKPYTLLHIVSHGILGEKNDTTLFWADKNNNYEAVSGTELVEKLTDVSLPHFAFLCACNSADPKTETAKPDETTPLGGLAQRLVRDLGLPAVIGMTRPVTINTALPLAREFYSYLLESGEVDVALQASIKSAGLEDRPDILTAPILFSRLGGRPLFISSDRFQTLNERQIKQGIEKLDLLLRERAPNASVLWKDFEDQKSLVDNLETQSSALKELNNLCYQVLGITFDELASGTKPTEYKVECPFPGLSSFAKEEFHKFFFGRIKLIDDLKKALNTDNKFLAVLGPSGSGKSSVVLAGLLPKLKKEGSILHSSSMTPGDKPMIRLKTKIEELEELEGQSSVLVVDQFEELFTLCSNKDTRQKFINQLLEFSQKQQVVITMRADFFGECASYENLKDKINQNSILIGPMTREELGEVIQLQAQVANLRFEAGVNNAILAEVEKEPGIMPLLQFALEKLYERRHGNWLRREEYEAIGGVQEAIATVADEYLKKPSENLELTLKEKKQLVKDIFLELVYVDERDLEISRENPKDTRKRVLLKDLELLGNSNTIRQLVDELASERLIVKTGGVSETEDKTKKEADVQVEVAHEALIQKWEQLRGWLNENRAELKLIQQIERDADQWQKNHELEDFLRLRGMLLEEALKLQNKSKLKVDAAKNYVTNCQELQKRNRNELEKQRDEALENQITTLTALAEARFQDDQLGALVHILKAGRILQQLRDSKSPWMQQDDHFQAEVILVQILGKIQEYNRLEGLDQISSMSFSPDGERLATAANGNLYIWGPDGKLHENLKKIGVVSVAFSDDSKLMALGRTNGFLRWKLDDNEILEVSSNQVNAITFSPDGKMIVTGEQYNNSDQVPVGIVKLWKSDGTLLKELEGLGCVIMTVCFSPDNQLIVSGGWWGAWVLWKADGTKLKSETPHAGSLNAADFSPDSGMFITAGNDGRSILWDREGKLLRDLRDPRLEQKAHEDKIWGVAFSPNGQMIATVGNDRKVKLWNLDGTLLKTFEGHTNSVSKVCFSPDSQILASASEDGTVKFWNLSTPLIKILSGHTDTVYTVRFSPDNKLFTTSGGGWITCWNIDGTLLQTKLVHGGPISTLEFSSNGMMVTASGDRSVSLWNSSEFWKEGSLLKSLDTFKPEVLCASFSPNNDMVATGGVDKIIKLWRTDGSFVKNLGEHENIIWGVSFSPEGETIASASKDGTVKLWSIDGSSVQTLSRQDFVFYDVTFSPDDELDNQIIAAAAADGTVRRWKRDGTELSPLEGHKNVVRAVCFSPNGQLIATASYDKTVKLWNRDGTLQKTLYGHTDHVNAVAFSKDGKTLASASNDKTAILWNVEQELGLDRLIDYGCDWISGYLRNNPNVSAGDKKVLSEENFPLLKYESKCNQTS